VERMNPVEFDFATVDRSADGGIVVVLFNGPEREVIAIAKGSREAAFTLYQSLGSVLATAET
jgi:hypothetical protein